MTLTLRDLEEAAAVAAHPAQAARPVEEHETFIKQLYTAIAFMAVFVVMCCAVYPVLVWGIAQVVFPWQANGSLVQKDGTHTTKDDEAVGSALLGQNFAAAQYFHPRPSAAGNGYDAASSSGTNLGPLSDKLLNGIHGSKNADGTPNPAGDFDGIKDLAVAYRKENGLADDFIVPADAVTRSASGLDPHISPENAKLQAPRVAKARGMSVENVMKLVDENTNGRSLGLLGEPGVRVLMLNLALDRVAPKSETR